ncbi:MAG: hypothetical protein IJ093_03625 [Bacilli bacterium]|nr:hypothetical protein [Bacilli bacterium]
MTNYDLEEVELLNWQLILSLLFILTTIISISLTYNQILKHNHKNLLFSSTFEQDILKINRMVATLIAVGFIIINVRDKKVKQAYNLCDEVTANLQISASVVTFIASLIVLYVAFSNSGEDDIENPEI